MNGQTLTLTARSGESLSRWLWLVKWILLIPHYLVLLFLWTAFVVLTIVAYVAVLITGVYPRWIFDFNVGVLRWHWRVNYYGYAALGTDRYPPFTLADDPSYPARLDIARPERIARWRPLVHWLLAIPHLVLLNAFVAAPVWGDYDAPTRERAVVSIGVLGAAVLILGFGLLFTGRRLSGLYDLLLGLARWGYRVLAYVALMTDVYPPFRLDQGDAPTIVEHHGP
ncbi:DUF4389 domain-containing protein [Stackebrandtia nassauensis]|uniref:Transmembrane protein n=1 Tax=Stackebrandtia nassauensis (strain DSM 44728 / CIP 108903 / NRRL B-16338 / NBRC 102104 / LLR-40K-21) TaxID=446470 RepID=D3PVK4_STANL|nr:DUF4389 domain-containing protein [Stackebrandtia nassauensis]ADD43118.1 hypothetical protein Snas_3454 [Stackebrandtia nassauensis DSM 44728]